MPTNKLLLGAALMSSAAQTMQALNGTSGTNEISANFSTAGGLIPRAHRLWTLSFGPGVGSDLRADREPTLGFDTAGPEAQPYHSINGRKAKGRCYDTELGLIRRIFDC